MRYSLGALWTWAFGNRHADADALRTGTGTTVVADDASVGSDAGSIRHDATVIDAPVLIRSRFTDRARKVLRLADQSARKWGHESVGTGHILLGLVEEGSGVAAHVLKPLVGSIDRVRAATVAAMERGPGLAPIGTLPQTPRAKQAIELSIGEAKKLNHDYVGTEHILLALLRESDGRVASVFAALGLDHERVRQEVLALLGVPLKP